MTIIFFIFKGHWKEWVISDSVQNERAFFVSTIQDPEHIPMKGWKFGLDGKWPYDDKLIVTGKYYWGLSLFPWLH